MQSRTKKTFLTILIALLGVAIGFWGELMPDNLKNKVETWATAYVGLSFTKVWLIGTVLLVLALIALVWKSEWLNHQHPEPLPPPPTTRTVHQHGEKSVYVEENTGDINIS